MSTETGKRAVAAGSQGAVVPAETRTEVRDSARAGARGTDPAAKPKLKAPRHRVRMTPGRWAAVGFLGILSLIYVVPLLFILVNSFKGRFFISDDPFSFPAGETFAGMDNYQTALNLSGFMRALGWSFFVTVASVLVIVFFCAMTAYYLARVRSWWTSLLYYLLVFSMVAPFQMVMFPTVKIADKLGLSSPWGLVVLYLGFGAGLSVFIFAGFVRSIPGEIEEAASIDGAGPFKTYFQVVMPMLKPTAVTVAILNTMWIWNDFLLPNLVIGREEAYRTVPVVIQFLVGSNGNKDLGAQMAVLVLAIIPIIIFYLFAQRYIVEGVAAGSVKG